MVGKVDDPLITCIIPTYKRPQKLKWAIMSVLNQTFKNILVCVYDNDSGDETYTVVNKIMKKDSRVRYYCHKENIGPGKNFQYGLERVETKYFSFLSDDDILLPEFYDKAINSLSSGKDLMFSVTQVLVIKEDGTMVGRPPGYFRPGVYSPPNGFEVMTELGPPTWTGILFRSSALRKYGTLDLTVGSPADIEFEFRLAASSSYVVVDSIGAIFVANDEASAVGGYCIRSPDGRRRFYDKIKGYPLPEELKKRALIIITRRHKKVLMRRGMYFFVKGNGVKVAEVAQVMFGLYGDPFFGIGFMFLSFCCRSCVVRSVVKSLSSLRKKCKRGNSKLEINIFENGVALCGESLAIGLDMVRRGGKNVYK